MSITLLLEVSKSPLPPPSSPLSLTLSTSRSFPHPLLNILREHLGDFELEFYTGVGEGSLKLLIQHDQIQEQVVTHDLLLRTYKHVHHLSESNILLCERKKRKEEEEQKKRGEEKL